MRVFKFGGASVKDANAVKNIVKVLQHEKAQNVLVVVSAMGKMTNAFENIVSAYFNDKKELDLHISTIKKYHIDIVSGLFTDSDHIIFNGIENEFQQLKQFFLSNVIEDYDYVYDQIVGVGELLSTKIVSAYLTSVGFENLWLDARELIRTDNSYRDAKVDWKTTEQLILKYVDTSKLNITQGFLGGNKSNTTTLGREGSDFTAAIFGYCLSASEVTIWKDVDGVLNAHPKYFDDTVLLNQISYKEATEMAFYGASVLHPKTLKPLENKLIPLNVRSFDNLNNNGTFVQKGADLIPKIPCFILKKNQILISISALDFSFMVEYNISEIFKQLHDYKLRVNLIQNSALSFSVCVEDKFNNFELFYNHLKSDYKLAYNTNLTLYTIRHFNENSISRIVNGKKVYLKQSSRETIQIITE